ncbi:hypothetical protein Q5P01_024124 [Channa striata]|uniref:Interleukin-1 n=1 Tax=Channa striata TaxID=64152 RepID=A0AA88LQ89_CHASR|nr:hypothetical protein Q5P01_024124 [Channa striata]
MADFDLCQALDGPDESALVTCETGNSGNCLDMTDVQEEIFRLEEGLDLVVSRSPKTMLGVANFLLAVSRFKKPLNPRSFELSDEELCSTIMENLVEETIVAPIETFAGKAKRFFQRMSTTKECHLSDTSQKALICSSQGLQLQAITLKGGQCEHKVSFKLSAYIPSYNKDDDDRIVALSIKKHNLHMSCSMNGDTAVLNLEKCSEDHLRHISHDGNLARFLFHKRQRELSLTMFESVQCPGWFISTSSEKENQPVEMCKRGTDYRIMRFMEISQ